MTLKELESEAKTRREKCMKLRLEKGAMVFTEESRTDQTQQESCDVNQILAKARRNGGDLPDMINANAHYGDFSSEETYQESLHIVMHAQEQFAALPSKIRNRFDNDPAKFLDFTQDPKSIPEMQEMRLLPKPKPDPKVPDKKAPVKEPKKAEPPKE